MVFDYVLNQYNSFYIVSWGSIFLPGDNTNNDTHMIRLYFKRPLIWQVLFHKHLKQYSNNIQTNWQSLLMYFRFRNVSCIRVSDKLNQSKSLQRCTFKSTLTYFPIGASIRSKHTHISSTTSTLVKRPYNIE